MKPSSLTIKASVFVCLALLTMQDFAQARSRVKTVASRNRVAVSDARKSNIDLKKDFSTLGDQPELENKASEVEVSRKARIIQNRIVDLYNRIEIAGNYALVGGGDAYVRSQTFGALLDYHITPKWSIGGRYNRFNSGLTSEGQATLDRAIERQRVDAGYRLPLVDYPTESYFGVLSYYPINGKLNLFDMGVSHFDVYFLGGVGQTKLTSGNSNLYTGGAGLGLWWTNYFTSRIEFRYESYTDLVGIENRQQQAFNGSVMIGILL